MYRSRNVMIEMLSDRGYSIDSLTSYSREEFQSIYRNFYKYYNEFIPNSPFLPLDIKLTHPTRDNTSIVIIWIPNLQVADAAAKFFTENSSNYESIILIIGQNFSLDDSKYQKLLKKYEDNYTVIFYQWKQVTVNITRHRLVPQFKLLSSNYHQKQLESIKKHYSLYHYNQLPIQLARDPISLYYGAKPGDIFKIYRLDKHYGSGISFRFVVKEEQCHVNSSLQGLETAIERKYEQEIKVKEATPDDEPVIDRFKDELKITDFENIAGGSSVQSIAAETEAEVAPETEAEVAPETEAEVAAETEAEVAAETEAEVVTEEEKSKTEQFALLLVCEVPNIIKEIRKDHDEHDKLPAHINLGYLTNDYDEEKIIQQLDNVKPIKLTVTNDNLYRMNDLIAFSIDNENINNIKDSIKEFIKDSPTSRLHMTLAYKRKKQKIDKTVFDEIKDKITIPIEVTINEIHIMKRNKSLNQDWSRHQTILLTEEESKMSSDVLPEEEESEK